METQNATKNLDQFNREYLAVHTRKEDLFWTTYMGTESDPHSLEKAETEFKAYISDPNRLKEVRDALAAPANQKDLAALKGWENFFNSHSVEKPEAQRLQTQLIEMESGLFQKRSKYKMSYTTSSGEAKDGSSVVMATNISASDDETTRKSSHQALLDLEQWVLANGFIDIVKRRNEFARIQGYQNYFEYRVYKNERLTAQELFSIFDEFEKLTRQSCQRHLDALKKEKGPAAILGHNLKYSAAGGAEKKLNPYLMFEKSLEMWCKSFARLGIEYRGATLTLDLLDRKGKYENGFMHGPQPCFYDRGHWVPSRINFTSNATPNLVGSGRKGLGTLFHEGGHAAHFANITMNAPCYSMEYPPTSMAYAETQSMFCDSLINDGDWLKLYAKDSAGNPIPDEAIREFITSGHPFEAFMERSILIVPYFESRLYSMKEAELTPENITRLARQCEREILLVETGPRPLLAIPHLLSGESACSYQGYLLANMAVYQTRNYLLKKYGFLADNPKVGPELAKNYWNPGNSVSHNETIKNLTGSGISGRALADHCNQTNEVLWGETQRQIAAALQRGQSPSDGHLNARLRIVHGKEILADNEVSNEKMWADFEGWIHNHYPT